MTAHIRLEGVDDAPATLSPRIITGLLHEELGFDGLVMSDAVEMRAISSTVGVEEAALRALEAGVDAVMLGAVLGLDALEQMHRALVERVPEERLAEAASRVEAARVPGGGDGADRGIGLETARGAVQAEGNVVLSGPALVIELVPEPMIAAGAARHGLGELLPGAETVRLGAGDASPAVDGREVVLVLRDPHRHAWQRETAEALLLAARRVVVVDVGLPQWRPQAASGYIATLGGGRANLQAAAELLMPGA